MLLKFDNVCLGFGNTKVVGPISFEMQFGETVWLRGANGSGKSTILNYLVGNEVRLFSGVVDFKGASYHPNSRSTPPDGLAYVPQGSSIFPELTIQEHFQLTRSLSNRPGLPFDRFYKLVERYICDDFSKSAGDLSGGQSKLLSVLVALASNPELLLLDEPFAGLDREVREALSMLLQEGRKYAHRALLIVEHVYLPSTLQVAQQVHL